jgi:hypothetical protein
VVKPKDPDGVEIYLPARLKQMSETVHTFVIFDTGCPIYLLPTRLANDCSPCNMQLFAASGSRIQVDGRTTVSSHASALAPGNAVQAM